MRTDRTYHINGVNVGKLGEELTTAEGELSVRLEELFSAEQKGKSLMAQAANWRKETKVVVNTER